MLSETKIKEIEKVTGIKGLQEAIQAETEQDVTITKVKSFTEVDYNIMYDNLISQGLTAEKYEEAKKTGEEMAVKTLKRSKSYEFEGKSVADLEEFLARQITLKAETDVSKIEKELQKDIDSLKSKLTEKDSEIDKIGSKMKRDKINAAIDNQFSTLQIEVPPTIKDEAKINQYIKNELEKNKIYFKSQYGFELGENDKIIINNLSGEMIKDDMANPRTIDNLVKDYTENSFMNLKQERAGRGGGDSFSKNKISSFQTLEQLKEYAASKNIKPNSTEMDALYSEFIKKD